MDVRQWMLPLGLGAIVAAVIGGTVVLTDSDGGGHPAAPQLLHLASAGGGAAVMASAAADSTAPAGAGQGYVLSGDLPAGQPGDQPVYRLRDVTAGDAATVAHALGLSGDMTRVDGGWATRTGDNRLVVTEHGDWNFGLDCSPDQPVSDTDIDVGCGVAVSTGVATAVPGCDPDAADCASADPAPQPAPQVSPGPSESQAREVATPIFDALGIGDATITVWTGDPTASVQAAPHLDGVATVGWTTSLQIDADGDVAWANGWLPTAVAGDRYPVISATDAFKALQEQPRPMIEMCMQRKDGEPGCADVPPTEVTGAELGLQLDYDGRSAVLVPAWLFQLKGQPDPAAQIAIDPAYLAPPPAPEPDGSGVTAVPPVEASSAPQPDKTGP